MGTPSQENKTMEEKIIWELEPIPNAIYKYKTYIYIQMILKNVMTHLWLKNILSHYRSPFSPLGKVQYRGQRISFCVFYIFLFVFPAQSYLSKFHTILQNHVKYFSINKPLPTIEINLSSVLPNPLYLHHHLAKSSKMLDVLGCHSKKSFHKMKSLPPPVWQEFKKEVTIT